MVSLWPLGCPMCVSCVFPFLGVSLWSPVCFLVVSFGYPVRFVWVSWWYPAALLCDSCGFMIVSWWPPWGLLGVSWVSSGSPVASLWVLCVYHVCLMLASWWYPVGLLCFSWWSLGCVLVVSRVSPVGFLVVSWGLLGVSWVSNGSPYCPRQGWDSGGHGGHQA